MDIKEHIDSIKDESRKQIDCLRSTLDDMYEDSNLDVSTMFNSYAYEVFHKHNMTEHLLDLHFSNMNLINFLSVVKFKICDCIADNDSISDSIFNNVILYLSSEYTDDGNTYARIVTYYNHLANVLHLSGYTKQSIVAEFIYNYLVGHYTEFMVSNHNDKVEEDDSISKILLKYAATCDIIHEYGSCDKCYRYEICKATLEKDVEDHKTSKTENVEQEKIDSSDDKQNDDMPAKCDGCRFYSVCVRDNLRCYPKNNKTESSSKNKKDPADIFPKVNMEYINKHKLLRNYYDRYKDSYLNRLGTLTTLIDLRKSEILNSNDTIAREDIDLLFDMPINALFDIDDPNTKGLYFRVLLYYYQLHETYVRNGNKKGIEIALNISTILLQYVTYGIIADVSTLITNRSSIDNAILILKLQYNRDRKRGYLRISPLFFI